MTDGRMGSHTVWLGTMTLGAALWIGSVAWGQGGAGDRLPEPIQEAVARLFPEGRVVDTEIERRVISLLEVSVMVGGEKKEVLFADDGTVISIEREVDADSLPPAVKASLREMSRKAKLTEVERNEIHAEIRWVRLASPRTEYEAEFRVKGRKHEVALREDGKIAGGHDDPEEHEHKD